MKNNFHRHFSYMRKICIANLATAQKKEKKDTVTVPPKRDGCQLGGMTVIHL